MTKRLLPLVMVFVLVVAACGSGSDEGSSSTSGAATASTIAISSTTVPAPSTTSSAPITMTTTPLADQEVRVWFATGDGSDCAEVSSFGRTVEADGDIELIEATLGQLLLGPAADEQTDGAGSFFSRQLDLGFHGVTLDDGLLVVDFEDLRDLIPNASTSCGSGSLLAQLNATTLQFEMVDKVRYEIDGSCDAFSNWLQRECQEYTIDGAVTATLTTIERASGSGCNPGDGALPDGRWFGYVTDVDTEFVSLDLACWFDGQAAADAAAEDGEESPPPNDYYVRNGNDLVRDLDVSATATVNWMPEPSDPSSAVDTTYADWMTQRGARSFQPGAWLTVTDGAVESIVEQYVP